MQVKALETEEEILRYLEFGETVYSQNPYWLPSDPQNMVALLSNQSAFATHSQAQAFWVEENDRILTTVTAVIEESYNRRWHEQMGHLLFFEALPAEDDAVELLMRGACDWLITRGCRAARLSLLAGWQLPLTIDAYEAVPTVFHTYNPEYYHSYIKNSGFVTERGAVQYQMKFTNDLTERYFKLVQRATNSGINLRRWDFDRLEEETEVFTNIYNESFKDHWGFMPLTVAAMRGLTVELKHFLVPDFMIFAELQGKTVGVVYALPDLNQALHQMKGKVFEDNLAELELQLRGIDHGVLLIIGVLEGNRGRSINLGMAAKSYLTMIERGYKSASYTVVLDDNWPSRRTAEKLGGRVTRNFNVYRKELI